MLLLVVAPAVDPGALRSSTAPRFYPTAVAMISAFLMYGTAVVFAAALGVGETLRSTGLAQELAAGVVGSVGSAGPWFVLAAIYLTTMLLTELLSNNATAALMYPIAMATARSLGVDTMPFLMAILVAASCGFATPIGYQTNLMVCGPGGYRFSDFLKVGLALDLVVMATALAVIPLVWPLVPAA